MIKFIRDCTRLNNSEQGVKLIFILKNVLFDQGSLEQHPRSNTTDCLMIKQKLTCSGIWSYLFLSVPWKFCQLIFIITFTFIISTSCNPPSFLTLSMSFLMKFAILLQLIIIRLLIIPCTFIISTSCNPPSFLTLSYFFDEICYFASVDNY